MTREQRRTLTCLHAAERALRENLHRHGLDPLARAHMQRAITHVRESVTAIKVPRDARTVDRLTHDLNKFDQLIERLNTQQPEVPTHHV